MQDICGLHVCIQQTNNPSDINCAGETRPAAKTKTIEQRLILNSCKVLNSASYWVVGCGVKPRRILPKCNMLYFCRWVYTLHHSFIPGRLTEYTGLSILLSFSSSLCRQELLSGLCCWIFIVSPKTSKRQLLDFSFVTLNREKKKNPWYSLGCEARTSHRRGWWKTLKPRAEETAAVQTHTMDYVTFPISH